MPVFVSGCAELPTSPLSNPQGIGANPDVARNDANVFFFEDFEDENYADHFSHGSHASNRQLVGGNVVFNGEKSLRITVNKNSHYGVSMSYRFADAGMAEPSELYSRYYLRFDDTWKSIKKGGKLPGPAGRYNNAGWGGRKSDGSNGWSARMRFGRSWLGSGFVDIGYYTYHADMPGNYGQSMLWYNDNRGTLQINRWYCIETYVKLNTVGKHDGILRGWVDGYLAMEIDNLMFRTTEDLKIEEFWVDVFYGGDWRAPNDLHLYIDNLALSTQRIGTAAGLPP
ncbi:MAG: polysaccharide lyase [Gammaproteobacteria bacterium]|nr:polysaccharide lyase [Gammaproteobacteria bacterium]